MSWSRAQRVFEPICWHAGAVMNGIAYLDSGWNGFSQASDGGRLFGGVWRTTDFVCLEKALGGGHPARCYHQMVSFNDELISGPGYDGTLPPVPPDDQVTKEIYGSSDGVTWVKKPTPPFGAREAGGFFVHNGWLYCLLGLWYDSNGVLRLYTDVWRTQDCITWHQRTADLNMKRRGFGVESWCGAIVVIGGRDDESGFESPNAMRSTNELTSISTVATNLPFGARVGFGFCKFRGRLFVIGGTRVVNGVQVWLNDCWSTDDPMMSAGSWVRHADLPGGGRSGIVPLVLPINGVDTMMVSGGKGAGKSAFGDCFTMTDPANGWRHAYESDLYTAQ